MNNFPVPINVNVNVVRYPLHMSDDILVLQQNFGEDHALARDIIVFIARKFKVDLFNSFRFTLSEFAKVMDYDKDYLRRTKEIFTVKPGRKKAPIPTIDGHKMDGALEYMLYRMLKENIVFSKVPPDVEPKSVYIGSLQLLNDLKINFDRSKNNDERVYEIRIAPEFMQELVSRYLTLDYHDYIAASKGVTRNVGGLRNLYVRLVHMMNIASFYHFRDSKPCEFRDSIDTLCEVANISIHQEPREKKRRIDSYLKRLQEKLTNIPFEFRYVSGDDKRVKYYIVISFNRPLRHGYENGKEHTFYLNLLQELSGWFKYKYSNIKIEGEKQPFQRWLANDGKDMDAKIGIFQANTLKVFKIKLSESECELLIRDGMLNYNPPANNENDIEIRSPKALKQK